MKPNSTLKLAIAIACFSAPSIAHAQIDSCNVFLQANHLEVGISPNGAFGSSTVAPAGYHASMVGGSMYKPCGGSFVPWGHIGFVADPAMDGWSTGTPPYIGDYFLPGSPFEGWSIQVGSGPRVDAYNNLAAGAGFSSTALSGSNTSYAAGTGYVTSTWEGMYDSIKIKQVTRLNAGDLFFTVKVTLTNLSAFPKNDVYYLRSVDPDNEQIQTYNYKTHNTILYQLTDSTIIEAVGDSFSATLITGSLDTNVEAVVHYPWPLLPATSLASVYNHTDAAPSWTYNWTPGVTTYEDAAIALVFKIAHIASVDSAGDSIWHKTTVVKHPANEASFTMFYAFSYDAMDSAVAALTVPGGTPPPNLGVQHTNGDNINIYPNPARNVINISGLETADKISLFDMMGRSIETGWSVNTAGINIFSTANIPSGNYILLVKDASGAIKTRVPIRKL